MKQRTQEQRNIAYKFFLSHTTLTDTHTVTDKDTHTHTHTVASAFIQYKSSIEKPSHKNVTPIPHTSSRSCRWLPSRLAQGPTGLKTGIVLSVHGLISITYDCWKSSTSWERVAVDRRSFCQKHASLSSSMEAQECCEGQGTGKKAWKWAAMSNK